MKKHVVVGAVTIGVVFLAVGCGKKGSGSNSPNSAPEILAPATPERIALLKQVRSGINEVTELQTGGLRINQGRDRLRGVVDRAITEGQCTRSSTPTAMDIAGEQCPVFVQLRVTLDSAAQTSRTDLQYRLNETAANQIAADVTNLRMVSDTTQTETGSTFSIAIDGSSRNHGAFVLGASGGVSVNPKTRAASVTGTAIYSVGGAATKFNVTVENGVISATSSDGTVLSEQDARDLFGG